MAHLTGPDGNGDRGQLLLVAVLVLAASFIVLALVINSAIFTENLATREDVAGSEEALGYRAVVTDSVGESVVAGNEDESLSSTADLEDHVKNEIALLRTEGALNQAIRGGVVDVSYLSSTAGQRVAQDNATRNFTSISGDVNWTVAEDVDRVRNVQFNFTDADTLESGGLSSTDVPFRLVLDGDSGNTWKLSVSNDTVFFGTIDTDETAITVERPDGTQAGCVRKQPEPDNPLTVDVTGGTVRGEPCHALSRLSNGTEMFFGTGIGAPFDIGFESSDNVNGTYSMVVDRNATVDTTDVRSGYSPDEPHVRDALYDVNLSYVYQSHAVAYEDSIQIAPGKNPSLLPPGAFYPEPDHDCEWVAQETNNGTDTIKIDNEVVDCDVVTDEAVEIQNGGVVLGDVESRNKTLDMDDSEVYGSVTTQKVADIQNGTVTDGVTSTGKNVKVLDGTSVGGPVSADEQVEMRGGSVVEGNVESNVKDVKILDNSRVEASVTAVDLVKLDDATVEDHVYIDESDFDCTDSVVNGQNCSSYTPKDPSEWPP